MHPLDNPVLAALRGGNARFGEGAGSVLRFQPDVAPFVGMPTDPGPADWRAVAALAGPGGVCVTAGVDGAPPEGWEVLDDLPGVQLVDDGVVGAPDPEAVTLGPADVPEMLDLVARTRPGPFLPRTVQLGRYLGVRRDGALVAMAGERMRPPGWAEVSAVCTDPAHRGQGLSTRLVRAVVAGMRERGERPFLHAVATNTGAVRLYGSLGFTLRREIPFRSVRVPA
ncbi:MAG TPA: GNAT family N-acetyltransferase [Pseudonocardia sp.]